MIEIRCGCYLLFFLELLHITHGLKQLHKLWGIKYFSSISEDLYALCVKSYSFFDTEPSMGIFLDFL